MNWILIMTLAIFIVMGLIGWYKGIIRIVVSIASLIIAILATAFLSPIVGATLKKNTKIYDNLCSSMYQVVSSNREVSDAVDKTIANNEDAQIEIENIEEYENVIGNYLDEINGTVNLPTEFGDAISNIQSSEYGMKILDGATSLKEIILRGFSVRLADVIFQAIVYIIVFVIIYVVLRIVVIATGLIAKLPVIHGANKMLGLVFGLLEGLLIVWLLYTALTAMSGTEYATKALADINNNFLLKALYDNNVIMKMIFH